MDGSKTAQTQKPTAVAKVEDQNTMTLAEATGFSKADIKIIQSSVAKDITIPELAYFLKVASGIKLNPLLKEIWCYKIGGKLTIFAGRDGFLTVAQRDLQFQGIRSSEVRKNDIFELDIPNAEVTHKITVADRGPIIGAYAIAFSKGGEKSIEWVDIKTYNRGGGQYNNAWDTHPEEMIKKVAEVHALRKAFGIHGLYAEEEFDTTKIKTDMVDVTDLPDDESTKVDYAKQIYKALNIEAGLALSNEEISKIIEERTGIKIKTLEGISDTKGSEILAKLMLLNE